MYNKLKKKCKKNIKKTNYKKIKKIKENNGINRQNKKETISFPKKCK
jgi:hypothetical protein